jgi:hypothetical protein
MKSNKKKQEKLLKEILEEADKITTVSDNANWIVLDPNGPLTQSLLKELKKTEVKNALKQSSNGFYQVDEHSHFWDSIETFLNYLNIMKDLKKEIDVDYLIEGFENSKKNGYELKK